MTYLRHSARHIQQTVLDRVLAGLTADGWMGPANAVPYKADIVNWVPARMDEAKMLSANQGNLVACSFGTEPDDQPQELGGGVTLIQHIVYLDIIGVNDALSLAIAGDLKDRLSGLKPGTSRFEPVYDYTASPRVVVDGWLIEFTNVQRVRPENDDFRRLWNQITASADVYLDGNE